MCHLELTEIRVILRETSCPCFLEQLWRGGRVSGGSRQAVVAYTGYAAAGVSGVPRRLQRLLHHPVSEIYLLTVLSQTRRRDEAAQGRFAWDFASGPVSGLVQSTACVPWVESKGKQASNWCWWKHGATKTSQDGQVAACHSCLQRDGEVSWALSGWDLIEEQGLRLWRKQEAQVSAARVPEGGSPRQRGPRWHLHMSQSLLEPCPLRQHLRSLQGLAGTIQSSLSPAVTWIWKGGGSANGKLLFSAPGRVAWWPCREQFLLATSSNGQHDSCS